MVFRLRIRYFYHLLQGFEVPIPIDILRLYNNYFRLLEVRVIICVDFGMINYEPIDGKFVGR